MTQTPHDQLAKQYLEEFLAPFGVVQRQYEVPGETKFVDVWFVPRQTELLTADLGLLGQMVQKPCLFEPYRNVPSRTEVRVSVMKLVWVQEDERRQAQKDELSEDELPLLWILAAKTSKPLLQDANVMTKPGWIAGVYFTANLFKTAIVAIDQLPESEDTLWLRVLGQGKTQERAIREVLALPASHPRRNTILRLLASWRVRIDLGELTDFNDQEELMALSEAFLTWEKEKEAQGEQKERQTIALNMLRKSMPLETIAEVTGLTIEQLQLLQTQAEQN
ncbi:flagellar assembly protein H [Alkalinema pantanalense CENA528]|uniref:flagellar assembly protein H n=1 Tax=Alkalinema pantanalense TaxID=1620705 RepID=UPI003D6F0926